MTECIYLHVVIETKIAKNKKFTQQ